MSGKGSSPRPYSVDLKTFDNNWNQVFNKKEKTMQVQEEKPVGSCGCGRSPTGVCCGWHALSEEEFRDALAVYEDKQNKENQ